MADNLILSLRPPLNVLSFQDPQISTPTHTHALIVEVLNEWDLLCFSSFIVLH